MALNSTNMLFTQRDLNCLTDPERNTRKRALEKINKELSGLVKGKEFTAQVAQECMNALQKPLLKCFTDQAEKCRELSVLIVTALLPVTESPSSFANDIFPAIRQRIGVLPQPEESEEVRLALLTLTKTAIAAFEKSVGESLDDVAHILEKASADKFPDAKRLTAELVEEVCGREGARTTEYCPALVKAMQGNLTHQQHRVRQAALMGIAACLPLSPDKVLDDVLPSLSKLNLDRSVQLREAVLRVAASLLASLPSASHAKLLPLLLHGAADDMAHVQEAAVHLMHQAGSARSAGANADGTREEAAAEEEGAAERAASAAELYPLAFKGQRPCAGARGLVRGCLEGLMGPLLAELADWSATTRTKAACTLLSVEVYAEGALRGHAERLLAALAKACMDDEQAVSQRAEECVRLAGAFVPTDLSLSIVDTNLRGTGHTATAKRSWSALMATLLEGAAQNQVGPLVESLCGMVKDLELSLPDSQEHQVQILRLLRAIVRSAGPAAAPVQRQLFASLLRLQGMEEMGGVAEAARETIGELGEAVGSGGAEGLYGTEVEGVLREAIDASDSWRRDSKELRVVDTCLRHGGPALAPHVDLWLPAFAIAADHTRDADVRSVLLVLLDAVLSQPPLRGALAARGGHLLTSTVIPVCVWRAGKVASALRKAGLSCLRALLVHSLIEPQHALTALGEGFTPGPLTPVLKSCMDDDDAEIRYITCQALVPLFHLVQGKLDLEMIRVQYLELLKRLDDSNDRIRIQAAAAFAAFLPSVPRGYDSGNFDYLVRGLVIHLDDQSADVQEGVLPALLAAAQINPQQFVSIVRECRSKHRSTAYCDRAIEHALSLPKQH